MRRPVQPHETPSLSPLEEPSSGGLGETEDAAMLEAVKALMLKLATGDRFERLGAIVQEHLLTGGKAFRARLALAAASALRVSPERILGWAAACELIHNASLIHDDLQDRDHYRRGRFSVWVRHGEAQAINAGDLLLMLPYLAVEHLDVPPDLKWELTRALARRAEETVRGQSLEMTLLGSQRFDWESYDRASVGKTSAFMALPVHGAALLAREPPGEAERLADCFRDLGLIFQMQNDVVDLFGEHGRERPGADLREGRVSALVVQHLQDYPDEAPWLCRILAKPRDATTDREVARVAERFRAGGALDGVLSRVDTIRERLVSSPELAARPALNAVAVQMADRCLESIGRLSGNEEVFDG